MKPQTTYSPSCDHPPPEELWYVPDRRIRTEQASAKAVSTVQWIQSGVGLEEEPDEKDLFVALHTCAYRAARRARHTGISKAERSTWANRWQIIRGHLVEANIGLAHSMVGQFATRHLDRDDMLSEAFCALTRAVDRFNPWLGFRFSTFACNVLLRALIRRETQENRYRRLFPLQHDAYFDRFEEPPDSRTELYKERLHRVLNRNLGDLTGIESHILALRFRMDDERKPTLQEIGDIVGLSKERVRQIKNIALEKLRQALAEDPLLQ